MTDPHLATPESIALRLVRRGPAVIALALLWMLLWGTAAVGTAVAGLALAAIVVWTLPLPRLELGLRLRPWAVVRLLVILARDLVTASLQVAWWTVRRRPPPRSAIVRVDLHSDAELVTAISAWAITLIPGSLVVEVDRRRGALGVHVVGADTPERMAAVERDVLALEQRIRSALGDPS